MLRNRVKNVVTRKADSGLILSLADFHITQSEHVLTLALYSYMQGRIRHYNNSYILSLFLSGYSKASFSPLYISVLHTSAILGHNTGPQYWAWSGNTSWIQEPGYKAQPSIHTHSSHKFLINRSIQDMFLGGQMKNKRTCKEPTQTEWEHALRY